MKLKLMVMTNLWPDGGTRGKVQGSSKSLGFILWGLWLCGWLLLRYFSLGQSGGSTNQPTDRHCHSSSLVASLAKNGMINIGCIQMEMGLRICKIWRMSRSAKEIGKVSDYRWISRIQNDIRLTYHLKLMSDLVLDTLFSPHWKVTGIFIYE